MTTNHSVATRNNEKTTVEGVLVGHAWVGKCSSASLRGMRKHPEIRVCELRFVYLSLVFLFCLCVRRDDTMGESTSPCKVTPSCLCDAAFVRPARPTLGVLLHRVRVCECDAQMQVAATLYSRARRRLSFVWFVGARSSGPPSRLTFGGPSLRSLPSKVSYYPTNARHHTMK